MDDKAMSAGTTAAASSSGTTFTLTATNGSSLVGPQYFNVYPLPMVVSPLLQQTPYALTSSATEAGANTTMSWQSGAGALAVIALAAGQEVSAAVPTPAALGSTVAITWADGSFAVTVTPPSGSPGTSIAVTVDPSVPPLSNVGLFVGPAPILVPTPVGGGSLTLTPDLTPNVTVRFGTAFNPDPSGFSDETDPATVSFIGHTVSITVGPDNVIVQTA
jgi:hypothetical protein